LQQSEKMLGVLIAVFRFHDIADGGYFPGPSQIMIELPLPVGPRLWLIGTPAARGRALPVIDPDISF
jgi:hypothetical protein